MAAYLVYTSSWSKVPRLRQFALKGNGKSGAQAPDADENNDSATDLDGLLGRRKSKDKEEETEFGQHYDGKV